VYTIFVLALFLLALLLAIIAGGWYLAFLVSCFARRLESRSSRVVCARCGYSLDGLDLVARCPECGTDRSLAPRLVRRAATRNAIAAASIPLAAQALALIEVQRGIGFLNHRDASEVLMSFVFVLAFSCPPYVLMFFASLEQHAWGGRTRSLFLVALGSLAALASQFVMIESDRGSRDWQSAFVVFGLPLAIFPPGIGFLAGWALVSLHSEGSDK
jgi:hypothetical protein